MSILSIFMLLWWLAFLIKGADFLVDGASAIAKKYGISSAIIGLTIVAFGTSMPELVVNVFGALEGNSGIAFGNIIGSNIANILLVLGVTGIITTLKVQKITIWKEIPFSLLAVVVLLIFASLSFIDGTESFELLRSWGMILLAFFVIFLYYAYDSVKASKQIDEEDIQIKGPIDSLPVRKASLFILWGLVALYIGGTWTVDGAIVIAKHFGLSDFLISATVIALWTSLPELVTSVVAARKGNVDLAVGNIVGSNIFNIFWILGVTAVITPIDFPAWAHADLFFLLSITLFLFATMFIGRKHELQKRQSFLFVILYIAYITFVIWRG